MKEFKKNKYKIVRNVISKELANFLYDYFLLKRTAVHFMYKNNIIAENSLFGTWKGWQVSNVYSHYSDFAMETLLLKLLPLMMKETELILVPTFSFIRAYEKGSILEKHKDRSSCEISATLNLGGDNWPIFLNDKGKNLEIELSPSDMLIYEGCEVEHWRNEFKGNNCVQVFLHYNDVNGKFGFSNKYDNRVMLGLPK